MNVSILMLRRRRFIIINFMFLLLKKLKRQNILASRNTNHGLRLCEACSALSFYLRSKLQKCSAQCTFQIKAHGFLFGKCGYLQRQNYSNRCNFLQQLLVARELVKLSSCVFPTQYVIFCFQDWVEKMHKPQIRKYATSPNFLVFNFDLLELPAVYAPMPKLLA